MRCSLLLAGGRVLLAPARHERKLGRDPGSVPQPRRQRLDWGAGHEQLPRY